MSDNPVGARALKATRAYRSKAIDSDTVDEILQAGRWTGSSLNSQPWTFVVVTDPELKQRLSECGKFAGHLAAAPLVIVPVTAPKRGEFDIGRAAQSMMLAADALGVGSCPATLHYHDKARSLLKVPPDHGCRHAIAFGYPDRAVEPIVRKQLKSVTGSGRVPLSELVRWDAFDNQIRP
jgi:nitroreductase